MCSFPNLESVRCHMSSSHCCFLTCVQISQQTGKVVWCSHLYKNFPQFLVIHTIKGCGVVNKADVFGFPELSCFLYDPRDVGNLISDSSAISKSSLNIWTFLVMYWWSLACRILSITLLACEMSAIVRYFEHSLGLEWKRTFSSPVATAEFSKFAGILSVAL